MKISIIEDHDQALKLWRSQAVKGLDLVHLDAHIDFRFHPAKPIEKIIQDAKNIQELKEKLEKETKKSTKKELTIYTELVYSTLKGKNNECGAKDNCKLSFDLYNIGGDCLAEK